MSTPAIGDIECPCCKTTGTVHRATHGRLYWKCACGGHQPLKAPGQDFILEQVRLYGPHGKPEAEGVEAEEVQAVKPAAAPAKPAPSAPKGERSSWGTIL